MSNPPASEVVILQVGEKRFHTQRRTLAESTLITTLLQGPPQYDGAYFIDNDPEYFEILLRFLRTQVFPLFFSQKTGHDECMYLNILEQARFYEIEPLENWISTRQYLDAVRSVTRIKDVRLVGQTQLDRLQEYLSKGGHTVTIQEITVTVEKCWQCPALIWQHHGSPTVCTAARCLSKNPTNVARMANTRVFYVKVVEAVVEIKNVLCIRGRPPIETEEPPPYHPA